VTGIEAVISCGSPRFWVGIMAFDRSALHHGGFDVTAWNSGQLREGLVLLVIPAKAGIQRLQAVGREGTG